MSIFKLPLELLQNSILDHKTVRSALGDTAIWQHLIRYPHLSRRIRSLTVAGELSDQDAGNIVIVPRRVRPNIRAQGSDLVGIGAELDFEYDMVLLGAMKTMINLRHFEWDAATRLRKGQNPSLSVCTYSI
ncbi:hypothetical protein M422DRAFT_262537 [Sphaerobolus stellatus SS14]|uniref:Unplaced genomic scaffold SPHSTscaffold_117, whole genome shotgun sequence n=1 Tax=Sphaerobolus stellatus (strain SS14) TaxID=990650 RepID=A0A0C9TXG3_SPHS4|nr:hypothetical protein M422DRAFT_262651 [Sphaerobolus stellatus SS14]KIJ35158.1 hypothetical protein M422DRAFT_262537 [Sphaerobolus stellatus SS14]